MRGNEQVPNLIRLSGCILLSSRKKNDDNFGTSYINDVTHFRGCADLCPKPNITDNPLSRKSHVEEFSEPVPALFQALTAEADPHERWLTFTYPVDLDMTVFGPKNEMKYHISEYRSCTTERKRVTPTALAGLRATRDSCWRTNWLIGRLRAYYRVRYNWSERHEHCVEKN